MSPLTAEQQADVAQRVEGFKKGHAALVEQYQVDILPQPTFIPVTPNAYGVALAMEYADLKYRNPSPVILEPKA